MRCSPGRRPVAGEFSRMHPPCLTSRWMLKHKQCLPQLQACVPPASLQSSASGTMASRPDFVGRHLQPRWRGNCDRRMDRRFGLRRERRRHVDRHFAGRRKPHLLVHFVQSQWGADENPGNDSTSSEFFMNTTGSGVTITVGGGSWDSEIDGHWISTAPRLPPAELAPALNASPTDASP